MKSFMFTVLIGLTVTAACSRRERPVETTPAPATPAAATPTTDTNAADADAAAAEAARREEERRRATLEERVHFEFDRADITNEARAILDRKLPILANDATVRIRVEGHADERGSVEYNLALSLRRANTARAYLIGGGIAGQRIEVAAFGEEQPLQMGSGENAWAMNRRAEFRITAGF
ncbi:MAG TPA: OmpA family protein [Longimicrobiales bacterium]